MLSIRVMHLWGVNQNFKQLIFHLLMLYLDKEIIVWRENEKLFCVSVLTYNLTKIILNIFIRLSTTILAYWKSHSAQVNYCYHGCSFGARGGGGKTHRQISIAFLNSNGRCIYKLRIFVSNSVRKKLPVPCPSLLVLWL